MTPWTLETRDRGLVRLVDGAGAFDMNPPVVSGASDLLARDCSRKVTDGDYW